MAAIYEFTIKSSITSRGIANTAEHLNRAILTILTLSMIGTSNGPK